MAFLPENVRWMAIPGSSLVGVQLADLPTLAAMKVAAERDKDIIDLGHIVNALEIDDPKDLVDLAYENMVWTRYRFPKTDPTMRSWRRKQSRLRISLKIIVCLGRSDDCFFRETKLKKRTTGPLTGLLVNAPRTWLNRFQGRRACREKAKWLWCLRPGSGLLHRPCHRKRGTAQTSEPCPRLPPEPRQSRTRCGCPG